jgi:hypothetical protein
MRLPPPSFILVAAAAIACSGDAFAPTTQNMAGTYYASTLTVTDASGTRDILAAGGSHITLTLMSNGTVGGSMLLKGGNKDGSDFAADLAGTWHLTGSTITFDQTADTFVRDASFTAARGRLAGEYVGTGSTVRVALDIGTYIAY